MKSLFLSTLLLGSLNLHAFSTITLKHDVELKADEHNTSRFVVNSSKGSDYCYLVVSSKATDELIVVPSGTEFLVTEIFQNRCVRDWGRQCRLDLTAENSEHDLKLEIMCKDRGMVTAPLTEEKVERILKNYINVE